MATSVKAAKGEAAGPDQPVEAAGAKKRPAGAGGAGGKGKGKESGLRIGDLVARVTETTGARRGAARGIVEAALAEIGQALGRGEVVVLPGLGRVWVTKTTERDGRTVLTTKMRRGAGGKSGGGAAEPLAKETDAG